MGLSHGMNDAQKTMGIIALALAGATAAGGLMINSSRAILYAGSGEDFAEVARHAALATRDAIRRSQQVLS